MIKIFILGSPQIHRNYIRSSLRIADETVCSYDLKDMKECSALILPGGGDIFPYFYGKKTESQKNINFIRDSLEFEALSYFVANARPVLGICKGMQTANVFFGGTLSDCKFAGRHNGSGGKDSSHLVYCLKSGFLNKLYGKKLIVNSYHRERVALIGKDLKISALSGDMTVEAMEHAALPVILTQFHPERMALPYTADGAAVFTYFRKLIALE